jgi:hypothetical protein
MTIENDRPEYPGFSTIRPTSWPQDPDQGTESTPAQPSYSEGQAANGRAENGSTSPKTQSVDTHSGNGPEPATSTHIGEGRGGVAKPGGGDGATVQLSLDRSGKLNRFTRPASDCINKAWSIARELNHTSITAAHLVLALTLDPRSSKRLRDQGVDIDRVRETAVQLLAKYNSVYSSGMSPVGNGPAPASDFADILESAARFAKEREDEEEINISDLLDAFPKSGSRTELYFGQIEPVDRLPTLIDGVKLGLAAHLDRLFDELAGRLPAQAFNSDQLLAEFGERILSRVEARLAAFVDDANAQLDARLATFSRQNEHLADSIQALGRPPQPQPQGWRFPWER